MAIYAAKGEDVWPEEANQYAKLFSPSESTSPDCDEEIPVSEVFSHRCELMLLRAECVDLHRQLAIERGKSSAVCMYCGQAFHAADTSQAAVGRVYHEAIEHDQKCPSNPLVKRIAAADDLLANLEFAVKLLQPIFGATAQVEHMQAVIKKARG
jgi:hypothetical protein